ncbi:MAG: RidA family protein [Phycisphaerales bacterium]|nr:RidA family protein [Phycisphaerales bacterium]
MRRTTISTGTPWEKAVGYSRAVRVGQHVFVSGTLSTDDDGNLVGPGDAYAQTAHVLRRIGHALDRAGLSMRDVVRTRMYITDFTHEADIARAHVEVFGEIRPAATMVAVSALALPDALIEIEVDAMRDTSRD